MKLNKLISILFIFIGLQSIHSQIVDPVKWDAKFQPVGEKNGEIIITATIQSGYHIYGTDFAEGGPVRTSFTFDKTDLFSLIGKVKELTPPKRKNDPFFDNMEITLHSKKAVFVQKIELKSNREFTIPIKVEYMACTDETCLPPVTKDLAVKVAYSGVNISQSSEKSDSSVTENKDISLDQDSIKSTTALLSINNDSESAAENEKNSLLHFLLIAFLAGLAAIFTPCVFPMIPMTVSYFIRNADNRMKSVTQGIFFGLSITLLYGLVGLLVSLTSVGANFAAQLSSHWIPNLIFFLLFLIFALSFLGLFEFILPSGLINAADRKADKGGLIGAFFMAAATVLVSFSCTGPIVGALLVEAAGKVALKPILGMTLFGLAFSLPFTIFAIFPSSLNKLPKSGGWLNEVKVVLGLLILAFGFKFLINIDQTYHLDLISRDFVLIIWIVLSFIAALYLSGKIRMKHDTPIQNLGVFRLILVIVFFSFSLYLFTGLLGKNKLSLVSGFLPLPTTELSEVIVSKDNNSTDVVNICDPPLYADVLNLPYGLKGYFYYKQALDCAKKINKPVLIDFKGHSCSNCKKMEATVWSHPEVLKRLKQNFVIAALYTDERSQLPEQDKYVSSFDGRKIETLGQMNTDLEITLFKSNSLPLYVIVSPDGKPLVKPIGAEFNIEKYIQFLDEGYQAFVSSSKQ